MKITRPAKKQKTKALTWEIHPSVEIDVQFTDMISL
jgi:hypothetical protein